MQTNFRLGLGCGPPCCEKIPTLAKYLFAGPPLAQLKKSMRPLGGRRASFYLRDNTAGFRLRNKTTGLYLRNNTPELRPENRDKEWGLGGEQCSLSISGHLKGGQHNT